MCVVSDKLIYASESAQRRSAGPRVEEVLREVPRSGVVGPPRITAVAAEHGGNPEHLLEERDASIRVQPFTRALIRDDLI